MHKLRIGKDFAITWPIYSKTGGEKVPYVIDAKNAELKVHSPFGDLVPTEVRFTDNLVKWIFRGRDQKQKGVYNLELVVNDGKDGMVTVDTCKAFALVGHSCEESVDAEGVVLIDAVTLDGGEVNLAPVQLPGESYDDTELREMIAEQDTKLTELSAEKEDKSNKVTSLTDESTDEQYPSAKAVYALKERISENEVLIEDLQNTKIEKENDDYYPKMAVGTADNLAGVDEVDSEFNFRQSGGGAITDGVARVQSIKGNSVVWNQLIRLITSSTQTQKGVEIKIDATQGTIQFNGTAEGGNVAYGIAVSLNKGDKCYMCGCPPGGSAETYMLYNQASAQDVGGGVIYTEGREGGIVYNVIRLKEGATADNLLFKPRCYNLTKMFGSGNEPTTIEEFYSRIPMGVDKNAYNEGEVIHMDVQGVESVGVNAWDEEWELGNISNGNDIADSNRIRSKNYIRVFPNTKYYVKTFASTQFNLNMFDADKQYVGVLAKANSFSHTMPSNVHYVRFAIGASSTPVTTYKEGICINIDDTSINDKYYPYIKRVENLAVIRKYFPNGMRSAGSAHDEIRYNKESGKWEKVVRIGVVDMGSLNWAYDSANARFFTDGLRSIILNPTKNWGGDLLCNRYHGIEWDSEKDKFASVLNNGRIYVKDTYYTDIDSFIASIAGVMLYYELAEPIITELDEEDQFKDLDYQVWNAGTEKAIAEGKSSPLAADITYGFNAIGKIKELESVVAALRAKVGI